MIYAEAVLSLIPNGLSPLYQERRHSILESTPVMTVIVSYVAYLFVVMSAHILCLEWSTILCVYRASHIVFLLFLPSGRSCGREDSFLRKQNPSSMKLVMVCYSVGTIMDGMMRTSFTSAGYLRYV